MLKSQNPKFINEHEGNFKLKENSPAINVGNNITEGTLDIEEKNRTSHHQTL